MRGLLCLVCVLCAPVALSATTVYRTVDEQGNTSFSDRPPPGVAAEELQIRAADPEPSPEDEARRKAIRENAEKLREDRLKREAGAVPTQGPPAYPGAPYAPSQGQDEDRDWVPFYYPGYPRPRPPWYRPPPWPSQQPPPIPRPNPESKSPRGLTEKLRQTR